MAIIATAFYVFLAFVVKSNATESTQIQRRVVRPRELDFYDYSQYIARTGHSTIVVGNYLYIDGGELYLKEPGAVAVYAENTTYSIDLSISWTNDTSSTPWYQTNKGDDYAPLVDNEVLWIDNSNTSFYAYDGSPVANSGQSTRSNQLWQFTPDGSDSGYWNQSTTLSNSIFPDLRRTHGQASTYGNGVGYALGGIDVDSNVPSPGLISYNTTSAWWSKLTTDGFTDSGTSMFGQLQYVPGFGTAGLLVALGGQTSEMTTWTPSQNLLSFQSVNIFDPVSGIWASQMVSGPQPPARTNFCSVGVQGDNGTYEIFIYGGQPQGQDSKSPSKAEMQAALDLDAVYVLSLPAFNWQKASYTPRRSRAWHTCNLVGGRQMVVVGGKQPWLNDSSQITDFWSQGLGIFDLSAMEWKDQYDAAAAPYVTPDVVKAWYNEHGRFPASWSTTSVEAWFAGTAQSGSRNLGAIAGGVVGAFLVLLGLGLLTYFLIRRSKKPEGRFLQRRRSTKLEELSKFELQKPELDTSGAVAYPPRSYKSDLDTNGTSTYPLRSYKSDLDTKGVFAHHYADHKSNLDANGGVAYHSRMNPAELDAQRQPIEKDGWQVHEVLGSPKYELP